MCQFSIIVRNDVTSIRNAVLVRMRFNYIHTYVCVIAHVTCFQLIDVVHHE